ncbi:uncharacterized protein LOC111945624 isoform X3 [Cyanistes caeruleus]|uniref:uncharacterized protein LOC111945624 isoform X3 n=1 Tax=Cyanistes caeruleus TaxID=156563 RepID=UPI000CDA9055|nr:uncharacterized protein LOC111945624 isoform X3 [Cyanistes caeruleus]
MAFPLRLFLLLLLAVALPDRAAQASPQRAQGADWNHHMDYLEVMNDGLKFLEDVGAKPLGEGDAASQPTPRTEALGDGEGVSAGRTLPAPGMVTAHKPSSHHRGLPREKTQNTAEEKSLKQSEIIRQMLKEMLQGGQGMKREPVQQETFPEGIIDSVPNSAAGREAMPGTVTQDKSRGKASPIAWLHKVVKPSAPPAVTGVSAERTFPAPLLISVQKPHFHRRGPPSDKDKRIEEKEFPESNNIQKQIVEELQKGPDMHLEVLWKAAFPAGSGHSSAASAAGRNGMAHMSTGPDTGDSDAGKAPPFALRYEDLKPSGTPAVTGVSAERISPAPGLDAAHKPDSHPSVPPTEKTKYTSEKKSLESFEVMWQMLKKMLQGAQEVHEEAVLKAVFPGVSSGSLAASAAGREAMPGTVLGDWDRDMDYVEALVENGLKFMEDVGAKPLDEGDAASQPTPRTEALGDDEVTGVSAGRTLPAPGMVTAHKPISHRRVVDQKAELQEAFPGGSSGSLAASAAEKKAMPGTGPDTGDTTSTTQVPDSKKDIERAFCQGMFCWIELIAGVLCLELIIMLCCFGIWYACKRKRRTAEQHLKYSGCTKHPDSSSSTSGSNKGLGSPLKNSERRIPEHYL